MAGFSTQASNEAENQAWLQQIKAANPKAYETYMRWLDALIQSQRLASDANIPGAGRSGSNQRDAAIRVNAAELKSAQNELTSNYPNLYQYAQTHRQYTGGLGQGGNELVAIATILGAGIAAGGAGAAEGAAGGGTAAGGGAAGGSGTAAGGTGVGTGGAAGGGAATGGGYAGLTDAAIEQGITGAGVGGGTAGGGITAGQVGAGTAAGGGMMGGGGGGAGATSAGWSSVSDFLGSPTGQGLMNLGAGYLQGEQNQQAANQYAQAQIEAARIAAEAARFKPVGVTTRFGQSNFQFDPQGRLTSAGYTLSPEMKAQQDALMAAMTGSRPQGMLQSQRPVQIAGARANGGLVAGGQTYLVGERGPEQFNSPYGSTMVGQNGPSLFTPPASGGIVPNEQLQPNNIGIMPPVIGDARTRGEQPYQLAPGINAPGIINNPMQPPNFGIMPPVIGRDNRGTQPYQLAPGINAPGIIADGTGSNGLVQPPNMFAVGTPEFYGGGGQQQGGLLGQAVGAQETTAPLSQGAQSLFNLGQGYLDTSPQEQAARYMQEQQALLAPGRERQQAALENRLQQQGRLGLAMGATGTMGAANPELEAFYNAQRQQDLGLAAQATQGGQQSAQFGADLLGTGGEMLRGMYGTQAAAYQPYQTALGLMTGIEGLGQNAMDIGINLGTSGAQAGSNVGQFLQQGYGNAATAQQRANQYNPWVGLLQGAANWY